ncbi:hypothetical protein TNCV_4126571 [Trichonephila clavipes]|nr:hypothetical protein TNCV_4126571 [Trichonephila clavipes]
MINREKIKGLGVRTPLCAPLQPTASSPSIQVQVAPSLRPPVSSRIIPRRLAEGHFGSLSSMTCAALHAHHSTPQFGVVPRTRKLDCSGM